MSSDLSSMDLLPSLLDNSPPAEMSVPKGLPTYTQAVKGPDVWALIIPYLDRRSLLTTSRLDCRKRYFSTRELWIDPVKTAMETQRPWQTIYNFMLTARNAGSPVPRGFVLILDFRPLLSIPRSLSLDLQDVIIRENIIDITWILNYINLFPCINSVNLDGLRYVDRPSVTEARNPDPIIPYLLSATNIPGLLSVQMLLLPIFDSLMFLDLSYSPQPVDWTRQFSRLALPNLRIVKLRGLRLLDSNIPLNILHTNHRLWSLDLRDNLLTDATIQTLLKHSFASPLDHTYTVGDYRAHPPPPTYRRSPLQHFHPMYQNPPVRDDSKVFLTRYLNCSNKVNLIDEPYIYETGVTHLHISNNKISTTAIYGLLEKTNRLQYLDVGSTPGSIIYGRHIPYTTTYYFKSPSITRRMPLIGLTVLRIHHSLVTDIPTIVPSSFPNEFVAQHIPIAESVEGPSQLFDPVHAFSLEELTLTHIPTLSCGRLVCQLTNFLRKCAKQERELADLRSLPTSTSRRAPPLYPGLRVLRLEFIHELERISKREIRVGNMGNVAKFGKSVSGDKDADIFQEASAKDFSFFGGSRVAVKNPKSKEEKEEEEWRGESGISVLRIDGGMGQLRVKEEDFGLTWGPDEIKLAREQLEKLSGNSPREFDIWRPKFYDVVECLKAFRKDPKVPIWDGKLELVFPA